jgi:hypothetical protein
MHHGDSLLRPPIEAGVQFNRDSPSATCAVSLSLSV